MSFEVTDRALSLRVRNVEVDLVLVRTEDIPGMLIEGVADVGITGLDLMEESDPDAALVPLVKLDFGFCRLAAAVPNASFLEVHGFATERFVREPPLLERGAALPPDRPGHGVELDRAALRPFLHP